jgi:hypothetical protein
VHPPNIHRYELGGGSTAATAAWLDPAKAQAWVLAQLKAQGITMRAA